MNLVEKAKRILNQKLPLKERMVMIDTKELCQAVVDAEEIMTLLKPIFHKMICEPDNCHCKAQISNQWLSRYAGEEKKDG